MPARPGWHSLTATAAERGKKEMKMTYVDNGRPADLRGATIGDNVYCAHLSFSLRFAHGTES